MKRIACACGREERIINPHELVLGVTREEAAALGWKRSVLLSGAEQWACPTCAGAESGMRRVS